MKLKSSILLFASCLLLVSAPICVRAAQEKDNLDDAIEGTQDAMNDAEKAKKKVAPPPVRRKHGWRPEGSAFALQCVQYGPCSTERFPGERIRVTHASYNWQRNIKASPERHVFSDLKQETYN